MSREPDDPLSAGLVHLIRAFRADDTLSRMRPGSDARRRRLDRHIRETAAEYGCDEGDLRQAAIDALSSPNDEDGGAAPKGRTHHVGSRQRPG